MIKDEILLDKIKSEIIINAIDLATKMKSKYVDTSHILLSLLKDQKFKKIISKIRLDYKFLSNELTTSLIEHIEHTIEKSSDTDYQPYISHEVNEYIYVILTMEQLSIDNKPSKKEIVDYLILLDAFFENKNHIIYNLLLQYNVTEHFIADLYIAHEVKDVEKLEEIYQPLSELMAETMPPTPNPFSPPQQSDEDFLNQYCINLKKQKKNKFTTPLVGHHQTIDTISQILLRKDKPNILIVGEQGIGKTKIIDGFATRLIKNGSQADIYKLDLLEFTSDIGVKGVLERRCKTLISLLEQKEEVIFIIDDIHQIVSSSDSSLDLSELLKPLLTLSNVKIIGTTTNENIRKILNKNASFSQKFYHLGISEPTKEETLDILKNIKKCYERFFNIKLPMSIIHSIMNITNKHIPNKFFPEKAIDVMDMLGAYCKHNKISTPSINDLLKTVSMMIKVDIAKLSQTDEEILLNLSDILESKVIGQEKAIETISDSIIISKSGLREANKTAVSLMFAGSSGVGKTELCKVISETLNIPLIRFDMSEYMEEHSVSKLIGAPPGYRGFDEGKAGSGLLINSVIDTPHCIILLDEIEKANKKIHNILLQVMDNGLLTGANGQVAYFNNVLLIMTTNAGSYNTHKTSIGFSKQDETPSDIDFNNSFLPEFRNRIDATIKFNELSDDVLRKITEKLFKELNITLKEKFIQIKPKKEVIDYIIEQTKIAQAGARPIKKIITSQIKNVLAKNIVFNKYKKNQIIEVSVTNNQIKVGK